MNYRLISSNEELKIVCEKARLSRYVVLDTEFVRTRTYYPRLGLIQLFDGEQLILIDPLSINVWQPFCELLGDETVTKVLHACSEDLEIFVHSFNVLPKPVIDTQILAAFIGYPLSSGFAALVSDKLGVSLDKSESRTDWIARPLTNEQCEYAAADVYYLLPLVEKLLVEVKEKGWLEASSNESTRFCQRRTENSASDSAYLHILNAWQLDKHQLATLRMLAAWRMEYAQQNDIALNFVVKEASLWQVARFQPTSMATLEKLGLLGPEIRFHGRVLLALTQESKKIPEEKLPEVITRLCDYPCYKTAFKALKTTLQQIAQEKNLSLELLGSRKQINQLLRWHWLKGSEEPALITGWRYNLFGEQIQAILVKYPNVLGQSNKS